MSTFFVKNEQIEDNKIVILKEDANHIKNVLRYKIGDELEICDENENRYNTKISKFEENRLILDILNISDKNTEPNIKVTLFQCMPKADKMELIIQKCTELGINDIIPVISERVVVKLDEKNEMKKLERWQKIAKEAATQSGRQIIPKIEKSINLKNIIEKLSKYDIVILLYECEKKHMLKDVLKNCNKNVKNVAIIVGPEGGFSENDVKILDNCNNLEKVSLGSRILRTETASFVALAIAIYELDSF